MNHHYIEADNHIIHAIQKTLQKGILVSWCGGYYKARPRVSLTLASQGWLCKKCEATMGIAERKRDEEFERIRRASA
jgi:hypothetical protein